MKITFLLPYADLSGGVRVVAIHARNLQEMGHQVQIVSLPQKRPPLKVRVKSFLKGFKLPPQDEQGPSHLERAGVPWKILDHPDAFRERDLPDADVLIPTWWETVELSASLPPSKGILCHFVQAYEVFGGPKERVDGVLALPYFKITVSRWLRKFLEEKFSPPDVALVPNAVDQEHFNAPPRGKRERPTVGVMHSSTFNKGCDLAFTAFEEARRKNPDLRLVCFGKLAHPKDPALPPGATYYALPTQEEIPGIYASCDAWIFPGRNEGFGLPILEAMACRTPVVATPAGAAPELLAGGGGILVPREDPQAMAEAILKITSLDDESWRKLSWKAWKSVQGYTWEDASRLFEKALERALVPADPAAP